MSSTVWIEVLIGGSEPCMLVLFGCMTPKPLLSTILMLYRHQLTAFDSLSSLWLPTS